MMHQALKTTDVNTFKVEEGFVKTGEVITKAGEVGKDMLDLGMFNVQNSAKAPKKPKTCLLEEEGERKMRSWRK